MKPTECLRSSQIYVSVHQQILCFSEQVTGRRSGGCGGLFSHCCSPGPLVPCCLNCRMLSCQQIPLTPLNPICASGRCLHYHITICSIGRPEIIQTGNPGVGFASSQTVQFEGNCTCRLGLHHPYPRRLYPMQHACRFADLLHAAIPNRPGSFQRNCLEPVPEIPTLRD